jgi:hypothetical protein
MTGSHAALFTGSAATATLKLEKEKPRKIDAQQGC